LSSDILPLNLLNFRVCDIRTGYLSVKGVSMGTHPRSLGFSARWRRFIRRDTPGVRHSPALILRAAPDPPSASGIRLVDARSVRGRPDCGLSPKEQARLPIGLAA